MGKNQLIAATQKICHRVFKLKFAFFIFIIIFKEFFPSFNYLS